MAAMPYPTPSDSSQPIEPERPLDLQYYLTEGLEGVEHHNYRDIRTLKEAVNSRADTPRSDKADESLPPYLIFSPVTPRQLANIDRLRKTCYKDLRFLYLNEPQVLIVKHMPDPVHHLAAKMFEDIIKEKLLAGGQRNEMANMGNTTYQGMSSGKQPDGSLRPLRARPNHLDWPTVIFEGGVSETPNRLTADGRWWIENSKGAVKIVLLFFASVTDKSIRIELWKPGKVEKQHGTYESDKDVVTGPTLKKRVKITPNAITGAPLKLKFKDILLRKPKKKRGEGDYIITEDEIREYYNRVWPAPLPALEDDSQDESCKLALFDLSCKL